MDLQLDLKIVSLLSFLSSEVDGDELILKLDKKKIWPIADRYFKTKASTLIPVDTCVSVGTVGWVEMELWEYDNWVSSSCLGKFRIYIDQSTKLRHQYQCSITSAKPGLCRSGN